jgi:glycosyltransferase involved in cell wall biosynthesis
VRQRAWETGPLRLVFTGNLIERKGLLPLLQAVAQLPATTCELEIIGRQDVEPRHTRRLRDFIHRHRLEGRVRLLGRLGDAELQERLRRAQVFACVSSWEGFGIVYLEAMGWGLPALASTSGAAGEIVANGENGFLLPYGDVPALAQAIARLKEDRQALARMGEQALQRYTAHPTWEDTFSPLVPFLQELVG